MISILVISLILIAFLVIRRPREGRWHVDYLQPAYSILSLPVKETLSARSTANERLRTAFDIDNAFTTFDRNHHKAFVTEVRLLLNTTQDEWCRISEIATLATHFLMSDGSIDQSLSQLMQKVTLSTVLSIFYGIESHCMGPDDLVIITSGINELWDSSKRGEANPCLLNEIVVTLRGWCQLRVKGTSNLPSANPLDFILPSYETLWRVVLHLFVTLRSIDGPSHLSTFTAYLIDPSHSSFATLDHGPSVEHMVLETLRLYPPTKRIKRIIDGQSKNIDVERLHRSVDIWGENANDWSPERWLTLSARQRKAFLAFGGGPLMCPANKWAPRLAGVIVAVLLRELRHCEIIGEVSGCDRMGYHGCTLHRRK